MSANRDSAALATGNRRLAWRLALGALVMGGFGYLLVPIYRVFCEYTGFNGTTARIDLGQAVTQGVNRTRWVTVETDADGQRKQEDLSSQMRFDFRRIGDIGYLAVSDVPNNPDGKREVGEGFALLRYVVRTDRIDLFDGDPRREAHRIAEGLVRGKVESGSQ